MSGPKTDHAEIRRQKRIALERERLKRIQEIQEAASKLHAEIKASVDKRLYIEKTLASLSRNSDQFVTDSRKLAEFKLACESCSAQLRDLVEIEIPTDPRQINRLTQLIEAGTKRCVADFEVFHNKFTAAMQTQNLQSQLIRHQEAEYQKLASSFGKQDQVYTKITSLDFPQLRHRIEQAEQIEAVSKEKIQAILLEVEQLVADEALEDSDRGILIQLAGRILEAADQGSQLTERAIKDYHCLVPGILRNVRIFENTYQEYFSEYVDYLDVLNKSRKEPLIIVPKERYRFATYEDLDREIQRLRVLSKQANEHHYIRSQIDEVMQMFGYDLSEEIVFSEAQLGRHYLCRSQARQSSIHVHVSDKQQIMLEVVSIGELVGNADPDINAAILTSDQLSEKERNAALAEQGFFCSLHPRIVEELSKRDVILTQKSRKQPDLKYSKMILSSNAERIVDRDHIINAQSRRVSKSVKPKQMELKS